MIDEMIDIIAKLPISCADVGEVELVMNKTFKEFKQPDLIKIDMSAVEYLTAPCMIYLIAITDKFLKQQIDVKYYLPEHIDVRNILRIWKFPMVLKEVTGRSFASLVGTKDLKYFGETPLVGDYYDKYADNDEGLAEQMKKDFFALTSIQFEEDDDKSNAIDKQYNKWSEVIIKSILKRHLANYDNEKENVIPNRIIYECMTNAFRHSDAVKLITGSYFDKKGKVLTITYWDNGNTIIETLEEAIKENTARKRYEKNADNIEDFQFSIYVKTEITDERIKEYYHSDCDINPQSSDGEILLHSFSPGVSRDPEGKIKYGGNPYIKGERPGMGLPTLLNAAIDLLEGSVAVRTGKYFINFKKPTPTFINNYINKSGQFKYKTLYKAKLCRYDDIPEFEGNMITIRLPLKRT